MRAIRAFFLTLPLLLFMAVGVNAQNYTLVQSTQYTISLPDLIASSNHIDGLTGATGAVRLSKITGSSGAHAEAASTNNVVEIDSVNNPGQYLLTLTATETNTVGYIKGYWKPTSADPMQFTIKIIPWNIDDATRLGLTALPNAASGAAGGLHILGTNATAVSYTGGITISNSGGDALTITSSGGNGNGLVVSGNGTGHGIKATGGATGHGILGTGGATSGDGIRGVATNGNSNGVSGAGQGTGYGLYALGGNGAGGDGARFAAGSGTAIGLHALGGGTGGAGLQAEGTAGNSPGANLQGFGTSAGMLSTGGATGDGIKAVGVGGGADIRGVLTGTVSGLAGITFPTNFQDLSITAGTGRVDVGKILGTVSAGAAGYMGIDWSHINAPTTVVGLSGTTVGTVTSLTNAPSDSNGVTLLLGRLTNVRATLLDNLDAAISSRMATFSLPMNFSSFVIDGTGKIQLQTTEHNQIGTDAANGFLNTTVDGGFNLKQMQSLDLAIISGNYTITRNSAAKTVTIRYYRPANPGNTNTVFCTHVTTYSDTGLTIPVSRQVSFSNLP